MLILPGIYRVIGNRGCNSYIIETTEGLIVVNTGLLGSDRAIIRYIDAQLGATPEDIAFIVVTNARRKCAESVIDLLIKAEEATLVIHKNELKHLERISFVPKDAPLMLLEGDAEFAGIKALFTPGYTPGGLSLLYKESLFIGGSVFVDSSGRISLPRQVYDRKLLLESLGRLLEENFSNIFPAHGRYIVGDARKKLKSFLESQSQR